MLQGTTEDNGTELKSTLIIRKRLHEGRGANTDLAWSRIARHFAEAICCSQTPLSNMTESVIKVHADDAFWLQFRGQIDLATLNLPKGTAAAPIHVAEGPMGLEEFLHAAKMVLPKTMPITPTYPRSNWPQDATMTADSHSFCTPVQGIESKSRMSATSQSKGHALGSKRPLQKSADDNCTPKTVPAGKRRRRRATAATESSLHFQSPPPKTTPYDNSVFFSPGHEAAQSLLALRKAVI
jgi:hypothetical protein